ncbi:hypothetical protein EWM64_g2124 [Hericium alpestre]|uniref:NmrA-like domain-containing protein n=1 Tax=Hericium alpestre TaxID=135208 RepID=A0A4Z0A579_9AGAM|nr:hypothetical protein EWM64_g2124 [Hericium alpestre]
MSFTTYAIAGIGNLGSFIAEELLILKESGRVKDVVLLSRSVCTVQGIEFVISTLPLPALELQTSLAQAAKAAGVRLFAPSEFATIYSEPKGCPLLAKYQARGVLKDLGLPYLLMYTGLFSDFVFVPALGLDIGSGKISYGADGSFLMSFTSRRDIAHFLARILTTLPPAKLEWSTFRIEGERISFNEIVRQYEQKTGKKLEVLLLSPEELEAALKVNPYDFASLLHLSWIKGEGVAGKPEELSNSVWPEWNPKKVIEVIAP